MKSSNTPQAKNRSGAKTSLSNMKMMTAIGAVGLTLAGWGVLAQVEATSAAQLAQGLPATFSAPASAGALQPALPASIAPATPTRSAMAGPTGVPEASPTAMAEAPAATPAVQFKLDIVQWVKSTTGERVAVVRDARGMLWYMWGTDVPLIEQGLSPQYPPQAVNTQGRSRKS